MDALSELFFEDTEDDGIQVEDDGNSTDFSPPPSEDHVPGMILDDYVGFAGLHQLIKRKRLLPSEMKKALQRSCEQVNEVNQSTGLAPIHYIALHNHTHTTQLLLTLLTYGNADIDARAADGKTALMLAVQAGNMSLVKMLLALGANPNIGSDGLTPLTMAIEMSGSLENTDSVEFEAAPQSNSCADATLDNDQIVHALRSVGATTHYRQSVPTSERDESRGDLSRSRIDHKEVATVFKQLNDLVRVKRRMYDRTPSGEVACEVVEAMKRMEDYSKKCGCRILCLDGGGVRGLVQIEILRQMEQMTGRRITELFDWIVGTSTGGIIALGLVYGGCVAGEGMSVTELQRFYLRLKRSVFSRSGILEKGNSQQLEWYLQRVLKGRMDSKSHPKVLVPAVKQTPSGIKLVVFNNSFDDSFSREEVWRVARYTSAAPFYFTSSGGYLDGGLLSNNPSEDALSAIQDYYRQQHMQLPISLVVSLGSGANPVKDQTNVEITTEIWNAPSRFFSFMGIIGQALMNYQADDNCRSRCTEQGITYVRLNPALEEEIDSAETSNDKLFGMLWATRQYLHTAGRDECDSGQSKMDTISEALLRT